jgi:hypothetical protein
MTTTTYDGLLAARMRRRARIMSIINVPMRRLLSLPFPTPLGRRLMLVTITGRKTGRVYRQPVSYSVDGDTLVIELVQKMASANPRITRFVPFVGSDATIDPARLAMALDHGFCVVRWHLAGAR